MMELRLERMEEGICVLALASSELRIGLSLLRVRAWYQWLQIPLMRRDGAT